MAWCIIELPDLTFWSKSDHSEVGYLHLDYPADVTPMFIVLFRIDSVRLAEHIILKIRERDDCKDITKLRDYEIHIGIF